MIGTEDDGMTDSTSWRIKQEVARQLRGMNAAPPPLPALPVTKPAAPAQKIAPPKPREHKRAAVAVFPELPELPEVEWENKTTSLKVKASTDIAEIKENITEVATRLRTNWENMKVPTMIYQEHDTAKHYGGYHRESLSFDALVEHQLQYHTERGLENTPSWKNFSALMQMVRITRDEQEQDAQRLLLLIDHLTLALASFEVAKRKAKATAADQRAAAELGLDLNETDDPVVDAEDMAAGPTPTGHAEGDQELETTAVQAPTAAPGGNKKARMEAAEDQEDDTEATDDDEASDDSEN